MIPKEKALELCNRFMICNSYQAIVWWNAKLCALIAVDEILNYDNQFIQTEEQFNYWKEVKNEIEKL